MGSGLLRAQKYEHEQVSLDKTALAARGLGGW